MNVIGHQNKSVQITIMFFAGLVKLLKIEVIIQLIIKDRLTIITTNNHMLRLADKVKPREARYLKLLCYGLSWEQFNV